MRIGYATAMDQIDVAARADDVAARFGNVAAPHAPLRGTGLLLDATGGPAARRRAVRQDLAEGFALWRLAVSLGWLDIKLRYRGSALGPLWLTLSGAIMVASMGLIYSRLFGIVMHDYLPFLALSMILWQSFIGGLTADACTVFLDAEQIIRAMRMPFTVQVLRCVTRNLIVLAHNLVVPIGVFAIFRTWPGPAAAWSLPGLVLWIADGIAACFLLGSICARFRDIPPIVNSIMQIAFYITPIVWKPSQLGTHGWWLPLNPFDALLEIVRSPLLGVPAGLLIWASALGYSLLLWLAALVIFTRARPRLAFWI
nr:ABC transporter permease [uncultured Lichenicoccus sp.]